MKRSLPRLTLIAALLAASGCAMMPTPEASAIEPSAARAPVDAARDRYLVGKRHLEAGDATAALAAFDASLEADAAGLDALNGRATALAWLGRTAEAIAELRRASARAPQDALLHNNLGYLLSTQGRLEEATAALRTALLADPGNARIRANWAALAGRAPVAAAAARAEWPAGADAPPAALEPSAVAGAVVNLPPPAPLRPPATRAEGESPPTGSGLAVVNIAPPPAAIVAAPVRPQPPAPAGGAPAVPLPGRLEVSNGAGTAGLARRAADALRGAGVPVARVTNWRDFRQATTTIRYRDERHDTARALQQRLGLPSTALVRDESLPKGVDARLLLGRDAVAEPGIDRTLRVEYLEPLREEARALRRALESARI